MRNLTPAYRRAIYFIVAAILAVLVAAGLITEAQYDSWTAFVEQLLPILGSGALLVAGAKTHQGSDDPTTREDVDAAYRAVQPIEAQLDVLPMSVAEAEAALAEARANIQPSPEDEAAAAYRETSYRE